MVSPCGSHRKVIDPVLHTGSAIADRYYPSGTVLPLVQLFNRRVLAAQGWLRPPKVGT